MNVRATLTLQQTVVVQHGILAGLILTIPSVLCGPKPRQPCLALPPCIYISNGSVDHTITSAEQRIPGVEDGITYAKRATIPIVNLLIETYFLCQQFNSIVRP